MFDVTIGIMEAVAMYGKLEWQLRVGEELRLECTLRPRGRPEKEAGKSQKLACPLFPFLQESPPYGIR